MKKLGNIQLARFCGQLKLFLASGIPLLSSLQMLRYKFIDQIIEQVSHGHSLAEALKPFMPALVISSLESAEQAGNLEEVLDRLAKYYEQCAETEDKIKSALVYPCFVIILCFISLIMIFCFVLPGFEGLFTDLKVELPFLTRALIVFGRILPILIVLTLLISLVLFKKTKKEKLDKLFLKSKLVARVQISHSFRTLGSLLKSGIPISKALSATLNTISNQAFKIIFSNLKDEIENGQSLNQAMDQYKIFPHEARQMIKVGENTGQLAEMLISVADYYEKERETFIKRFTALLEPGLTLFVGIIVGLVVLAMFLPMMNVMSQLQ